MKKRILLFIALLICATRIVLAQTSNYSVDQQEKVQQSILKTNYDSALVYAQEGFTWAEENADTLNSIIFQRLIGTAYYYLIQRDKSLETFLQILPLCYNGRYDAEYAALCNNIGGIYTDFEEYEKGEKYLKKGLEIYAQMDKPIPTRVSQTRRILASNYSLSGKFKEGEKLMLDVLASNRILNDSTQMTGALIYLGDIYLNQKRYSDALVVLNEGYLIQSKRKNKDAMIATLGTFSRVYKNMNKMDSAFHYQSLISDMRTKIFQNKMADKVSEMEVEFETERHKKDAETKALQLEVVKNNNKLLMLAGGSLLILILLLIVYGIKQKQLNKLKQERALQVEHTKAVLEGEEKERERLARELHDGVGQLLAGIRLNLNSIDFNDNNSLELLDRSIKEVRNISHDLLPDEIRNQKLTEAVSALVKKNSSIRGLKIKFNSDEVSNMDAQSKKHIYRVIQELLSNGIKHSKAKTIELNLRNQKNKLQLRYQDDGKGITERTIVESKGIGWKNILARVEILKGEIHINGNGNGNGNGTSLIVEIPKT